ncbi:MAG: hypothetical protein ACREQ5_20825 [Candidatus Dormibacteria bacterium]
MTDGLEVGRSPRHPAPRAAPPGPDGPAAAVDVALAVGRPVLTLIGMVSLVGRTVFWRSL